MAYSDSYKVEQIPGLPDQYSRLPLQFASEQGESAEDAERHGLKMTREQFGRYVARRIKSAIEHRRVFDDQVRDFRAQYRGEVLEKNDPWENCSNLSVPLTQPTVESIHAQLYKTITGVKPIFHGENSDPNKREDTENKERALEWIMRNITKFPRVLDEWVLVALRDRTGVLQITWDVQIEKVRDYLPIDDALVADLTNKGLQGQLAGKNIGDEAIVTREIITREAVNFKVIDLLDFGVYPNDASSLKAARIIYNRYWATRSDLNAGVKSGMYEKDAVKELLERASGSEGRGRDNTGGDESHLNEIGLIPETEESVWDKPYQMFTAIVKHDCDGDGIDELALVDIEIDSETIVRAELYPYFHNKPFYVLLNPYIDPGQLYGFSLPQKLRDVQDELDATHNQKVDRATLENDAPIVANRALKTQLESEKVGPGRVLYVDGLVKDAIAPLSYANGSQRTIQEEEFIKQMGYEVAGINNTVVGQTNPNASENTLGEIEHTLQSVNTKFDVIVDRTRDACAEVANQVVRLYGQYQPADMPIAFSGEQGEVLFKTITRQDMRGDVGFVAQGTSALANLDLQAQIAEKLFMIGERSPFTQANLVRLYELTRLVFKSYGIDDFASFIGTAAEAAELQKQVDSAPEPKPETKISESRRIDEVSALALLFKSGELTPEEYMATAEIAAKAAEMMPTPPMGTESGDNADNPAGYQKSSKGSNV